MTATTQHNTPEFSVRELSSALKGVVEQAFSYVRVRGEISGLKAAPSGHTYFSLKDEEAVLAAICWRGTVSRLSHTLEDGLEVICTGKLTTYPGQSKYQLIAEKIEPAGIGALMALLEKRKQQLQAEGLFDASLKKHLPFFPKVIGVITSPTGAVIRDMIHRLRARCPVHLILWPVLVQGEHAAEQISAAIQGFNQLPSTGPIPKPDLLIVARGGGSLEDLWAFNEEKVVRAAASSHIPLISAVGHETDTTLIDFAADLRAPTPSAAAEIAVPVFYEIKATVIDYQLRLPQTTLRLIRECHHHLKGLWRGLPHPQHQLTLKQQIVDELYLRLCHAAKHRLYQLEQQISRLSNQLIHPSQIFASIHEKLHFHHTKACIAIQKYLALRQQQFSSLEKGMYCYSWEQKFTHFHQTLLQFSERQQKNFHYALRLQTQRLEQASRLLDSFHYAKVLERGFVLVRTEEGAVITRAKDFSLTQSTLLEFFDGTISLHASESTLPPSPSSKSRKAPAKKQPSLFE